MTHTRYPLESFDPRFRSILLAGALRTITLPFPTHKQAAAFQVRLHTYRSRVRKELGQPAAAPLYRCRTSLRAAESGHGFILVLHPWDSEHNSIFEKAGFTQQEPAELPNDILADLEDFQLQVEDHDS
ncbi:MAG: hypothetical protein ACREJW_00120 [Candidatus Methylomirabilales bacterium]